MVYKPINRVVYFSEDCSNKELCQDNKSMGRLEFHSFENKKSTLHCPSCNTLYYLITDSSYKVNSFIQEMNVEICCKLHDEYKERVRIKSKKTREKNKMLRDQQITQVENNGGPNTKYDLPEGADKLQDLIEYKNMNFSVGNMFKACYRLGDPQNPDVIRDLQKIKFFVERELNLRDHE